MDDTVPQQPPESESEATAEPAAAAAESLDCEDDSVIIHNHDNNVRTTTTNYERTEPPQERAPQTHNNKTDVPLELSDHATITRNHNHSTHSRSWNEAETGPHTTTTTVAVLEDSHRDFRTNEKSYRVAPFPPAIAVM